MTDKKLTDEEIIKALEWLKSKTKEYCKQCAYKDSEVCDICVFSKIELSLDLINRLQAEIERLKENLNIELENYATEYDNKIKAEAYKECVEKIQNQIKNNNAISAEWLKEYLYNILKELVGDDK